MLYKAFNLIGGPGKARVDRVDHRVKEADKIEGMEFFNKDRRRIRGGEVGPLLLDKEEKKAQATWVKIIDERRVKLMKANPGMVFQRGRAMLNRRAALGLLTGG